MWSLLLPRKPEFFTLFSRHAQLCVQGARQLRELLRDPAACEKGALEIHATEHEADAVCQQTLQMLHISFITPIERGDIHRLTSRIDDVMDHIEETAQCVALHEIREPTHEALEMAENAVLATQAMKALIDALGQGLDVQRMRELAAQVKRVEKENDRVLRRATARLFKEGRDPFLLIRWKQIYADLELAIDRCEDVANIVEGVVLENS
jgi:predicted phosphate transport protein (TIGR00153 family)